VIVRYWVFYCLNFVVQRLTRYDASMNTILLFINICRFRASPSDVASSSSLLPLSLACYFVLGVIIGRIDDDWSTSVAVSLTDLLMMVIVMNLLLKLRGLQPRLQQTLTAMAGAGSCLAVIGIPIIWAFSQMTEQDEIKNTIILMLMITFMFWNLMVNAHIFRHALDIKANTAAMITVAYTVLSIVVVGLTMSGVA